MTLTQALTSIRRELAFYRALWRDERTPQLSRWALGLALAYLVNPIDLIPDFVPILGQLDDLIIVGGLVALARALIPQSLLDEHRAAFSKQVQNERMNRTAN